ncbi:hypothetical protein [Marispirochaeta aestuarii]|uniref:hypothetical protein n=1 Tax=Marispirochaeta aestuarii TaxID=1963862 RepID=UPI0029C8C48F|nr:hypothetical protein [Marispirochaeta aestuarii]
MKTIRLMAGALVLIMVLGACGGNAGAVKEEATAEAAEPAKGITLENAFYYTHVDGHKKETQIPAVVLFEYEQLKTVRYQVAYIACTCRGPEVNYWSVANVEINKSNLTVDHISYHEDSTDHYVAGMYGDSTESWDGTPVRELFDGFIQDSILGKSENEIDAYVPMHGEVDTYTGATVTPNNAMRMLQGLFEYHKEHYGSN